MIVTRAVFPNQQHFNRRLKILMIYTRGPSDDMISNRTKNDSFFHQSISCFMMMRYAFLMLLLSLPNTGTTNLQSSSFLAETEIILEHLPEFISQATSHRRRSRFHKNHKTKTRSAGFAATSTRSSLHRNPVHHSSGHRIPSGYLLAPLRC